MSQALVSKEVLENTLAQAMTLGGEFAEVFVEDRVTSSAVLDQRRIEELSSGRDRGAGIRVVAISGNHDAQSIITRRLRWPDGARMLPSDRAETIDFPELGIAVHGRGFAGRARHRERCNGDGFRKALERLFQLDFDPMRTEYAGRVHPGRNETQPP